jgi:hypothetical protein
MTHKEGQFVHRLEEAIWPERFPLGHPRHDPDHGFWHGELRRGETFEQVTELVTKELEKNSWPGPRGFEKVHVQE